jgi:hypothetical protein
MISQYIKSVYLAKLGQKSGLLDKLQAEREALRVRAQSYKGRAKGRVIPKAYELDGKIRELKNPDFQSKIKFIGDGEPVEKTFGNLFTDYTEDLVQSENLRNIFTFDSLQRFVDDAEQTIIEARIGFTQKMRVQKELTRFITAVLDDYDFSALERNLDKDKKRKFYPPLNSFLYKLPPVEFAERAQMLSEARTPTDDIFVSARDTVELYYTNSESAPNVIVKFEASGFNTPEIDEEKMFKGVDAGEGFALVEDKSLSPRYGYSDEYFSVVARLDFANHKHGQKIFLVKLQYQYVWSEKGKTNHKKAK